MFIPAVLFAMPSVTTIAVSAATFCAGAVAGVVVGKATKYGISKLTDDSGNETATKETKKELPTEFY